MDPLVLSSLIGGGSNVFGNLVNYRSNKETNKANREIAQLNNEFNERMLQKEMDYNIDMWNKTNEYNTPLAQRSRYKAAGINPYMALGSIQSGQAGSVGGVHPPSASPVTMQPFQSDFSGIGAAAQNYVANKMQQELNTSLINKQDEEAEGVHIENKYRAAKILAGLEEMRENTRSHKLKNDFQEFQNSVMGEIYSTDMLKKRREIESIEAGIRHKYVQIAMDNLHLANLPEQYRLSFASASADIALKAANKELTEKQAIHEVEKTLETIQKANGLKIENYKNRSTSESFIRRVYAEERKSKLPNNIYHLGFDAYEGFNKFADEYIFKPSKKLWKDTRRSFGF